jgi:hypothetical protein
MLFKEIIIVYNEKDKKKVQNSELLIVETPGTYSYRSALKC